MNAQVSLDTAGVRSQLREAQAAFNQYAYPQALVAAEIALGQFSIAPDTMIQLRADAYRIRGGILTRMGQSEEARKSMTKAAEIYTQISPLRHALLAQLYSNIGISHIQSKTRDFAAAIPWFRKAAEIMQASEEANKDMATMDYIGNIGLAQFYLNQFKQAEITYLEALNYIEDPDEKNGDFVGTMEFRLGLLYERKGNLADALHQYEQALNHYQLKVKEDPLVGNIYRSMAHLHYKRGDYEKALLYAEKSRVLFAKLIGPATEEYLSALDIQSISLEELGRYKLSQKSDSTKSALLQTMYQTKGPVIANHEANMALKQAKKQKNPTIAIEGLQGVLKDLKQMSDPVEEEIANYTLELGLAYLEHQQLQEAEDLMKQSLVLHEKLYAPESGEMVHVLFALASFYTQTQDFEGAIPYFEKAVNAARLTESLNVNQLAYPLVAIEILEQKGALYAKRFEQTQDLADFQKADSLLQQGLNLVEAIQASAVEENSKISLQDKITPILETKLQLLWQQYTKTGSNTLVEDAFKLMERGKNFVLLQSMIRSNTRRYANIPDSLVQKEVRLREDIAFYEKEIFLLQQGPENLELEKTWTDLLLDLKNESEQLQERIQNQYPAYFDLKNQQENSFSFAQVQRKIGKNQAFLEYFIGSEKIYILKISKTQAELFQLEKAANFEVWIWRLQQSLLEIDDKFIEPAQELYTQLLEPLGNLPESIIIVPDGILAYLPFEALLSKRISKDQSYQQYPFVIREKQISYNFSGALWEKMGQKKYPKRGLLAVAPSFANIDQSVASRSRNLGPLIFNRSEVEQIGQLFKRKTLFYDSSATLANFQAVVQNHHLLHLATHAKVDDRSSDYSYLAFYGVGDTSLQSKLFVRDLFSLQLPLDLVTLSACETGIGVLQKGEGVISLARGFAYAGAKSMVTSLWTANDLSTAEIMTAFYKNLKNGQEKDEALRAAKLNFLDQKTLAHPHYWATFIPFGDMESISRSPRQKWFTWSLLPLLALAFFFFYFNKKQNKG
ncbi:MAG: CHAT domain-containing protein [Saprospiraceae bacterium]